MKIFNLKYVKPETIADPGPDRDFYLELDHWTEMTDGNEWLVSLDVVLGRLEGCEGEWVDRVIERIRDAEFRGATFLSY